MPLTLEEIATTPHEFTWDIELPSGSRFTLRPLESTDVHELARFFSQLSATTRQFYDIPAETETLAHAHCAAIAAFDKLRMVLDTNESIGGIVEFSLHLVEGDLDRFSGQGIELVPGSDIGYGLCLRDDLQGSDVGSAIQPIINDFADELGARRLILWGGVMTENVRAREFYRRQGFVEAGTFVSPDGRESVDMLLEL